MSHTDPVPTRRALYGRDGELGHLVRCWERARAGDGNTILVSGEAGIGKSRLASELKHHARKHEAMFVRLQCSAVQLNTELHPLHDWLARVGGPARSEAEERQHARIRALLLSSNALQSPRRNRDERLDALVEVVLEVASSAPLLLIFEDAQWLDPTSNALLERLVERSAAHCLLIVVTARRGFDPSWIGLAETSVVIPRRLGTVDTIAMVNEIAKSQFFSPEELRYIVSRSEGVPLFIEELSKEKPAKDAALPGTLKLSSSLQALLMERLEKLGELKSPALIVSAFGQSFRHQHAAVVYGRSEVEFAQMIGGLMAADVLRTQPIGIDEQYTFRHALVHEAAYASLPLKERVVIHARIVDALVAGNRDAAADRPQILAHHSDRAGMHLSAASQWLAAGKKSADRGAVDEAVSCFRLGLDAASRAAPGTERERLEFQLDMNLGPALMARNSYASAEALDAFSRARNHLHYSQSSLEEIHVLLGLFNVHFGRGEFVQALDVAKLADQTLSVGYGGYPVLTGQALCMMGQFAEARDCLQRALERYNPSLDTNSGLFCNADVVATAFLAKVEFSLGNLDRCSELTRATMDLARQQGHPVALAIAYLAQLFLATEMGDHQDARAIADVALEHVTQHKLDNYRLWVAFHRAALSLRAQPSTAIATMHQVIAEADEAGTLMFRPFQLGLLGVAYASTGRTVEALALIDEGLEMAQRMRGMEAVPALHRLRGRAIAASSPEDAIKDLEASLAMARHQSARMEELRTATVLAHMLRGTDRQEEARQKLTKLVQLFADGSHFPDLKQAAKILASLEATKEEGATSRRD